MIKVTDIVEQIVKSDELALESLREGLLNLSAYADKIHSQVENATFKEIRKGTIVVALSRLAKDIEADKTPPLKPQLKLNNIGVKSSLYGIVFDKTADIQRKISVLHPFQISIDDLFALSEGSSEVTLICTDKSKDKILSHFGAPAKFEFDDLVAITVQYSKDFAQTPNIYYVLISALAQKRINIVEIIANYTEVSFIVKKQDMEEALAALNMYFAKS